MTGWHHRHILDLASFSREDFAAVLELAERFRSLPVTGARRLPALQGRLVATLFFEPSTRTRSSFELAAKRNGGCDELFALQQFHSKGKVSGHSTDVCGDGS